MIPAGACRPFDKDRNGFVFGEAGALMVIETEEHAKARGANILARLMGASVTSDGFHMVAPDPNGERAGHAITRAIQLAGLQPCRHRPHQRPRHRHLGRRRGRGQGHQQRARQRAAATPRSTPPRRALGHSVGAVGAVESILTVQALRDRSSRRP